MFKFEFKIRDAETDEIITSDWALFDLYNIDEFGGVETVDKHVGSAMRYLRRRAAKLAIQGA